MDDEQRLAYEKWKEQVIKEGAVHWDECSVLPCIYKKPDGTFITFVMGVYEIG